MAKILVIMQTYDRQLMAEIAVKSLMDNSENHDFNLWIYDDNSPVDYLGELRKHRFTENNGKGKYWKLVNKMYQDIRDHFEYDYYFHLPDDITVTPGFFAKAITLWESIKDEKKICLNLIFDEHRQNKGCWTGFNPVASGSVIKTQWVDMCYMCDINFFKKLNFEIHPIDPNRWNYDKSLSSGVGAQISLRLFKENNLYQVKKSLVLHGDHESKMNPEERKKNPLISK